MCRCPLQCDLPPVREALGYPVDAFKSKTHESYPLSRSHLSRSFLGSLDDSASFGTILMVPLESISNAPILIPAFSAARFARTTLLSLKSFLPAAFQNLLILLLVLKLPYFSPGPITHCPAAGSDRR
jgi:hypothetical protein